MKTELVILQLLNVLQTVSHGWCSGKTGTGKLVIIIKKITVYKFKPTTIKTGTNKILFQILVKYVKGILFEN